MLWLVLILATVLSSSRSENDVSFDRWSSVLAESTLFFDLMDTDRDWVVSTSSRDAYFTNLDLKLYPWSFETMDEDEDGYVDRLEWRSWFAKANVVLRLSFRVVDFDNSGGITLSELQRATLKLPISSGYTNTNRAFNYLLSLIDISGQDRITLQEWESSAAEGKKAVATISFALIDEDGDGEMSLEDLKQFLLDAYKGAEDGLPISIIAAKFRLADKDHDGLLNQSEFKQWLGFEDSEVVTELFNSYASNKGVDLNGFKDIYLELMEPGIRRIHKAFDVNDDGVVDLEEFIDIVLPLLA